MSHNSPVFPRPLSHLCQAQSRVLNSAQLRAHGVTPAAARDRCRPGGSWQQLLPGVFLLHPGPPSGAERLHAALLYAVRGAAGSADAAVPAQAADADAGTGAEDDAGTGARRPCPRYADAMITGLAALALHRFTSAPPLPELERIDVLVPRTRRLRSASFARLVHCARLPDAQQVGGVPVAPVGRALADAVARLSDPAAVHEVLAEAVYGGHCDPAGVVPELRRAHLLELPHVAEAVESLLDTHRPLAEDLLYRMVRENHLAEPLWNVELQLPGGPHLGAVDAYWPDQAVALELDCAAPRSGGGAAWEGEEDVLWARFARDREHLRRLGIAVVRVSPRALWESPRQQAVVVRTALMAAEDGVEAGYVRVLPR